MNEKKFFYYGIPVAILLAGLFIAGAIYLALTGRTLFPQRLTGEAPNLPTVSEELKKEILKITPDDHVRGNKDAKVVIVEYSDLQCPFCARFHPTMMQLLANYPQEVAWVYRHFPLDVLHPEARPAAEASECVWEQKGDEGFWQFVDGVFANQSKMGKELYNELAQTIGVDMKKFEECVKSRKYKDKVEAHFKQGEKLGIGGTPTSFINGTILEGAYPYEEVEKIVKSFLR